MRIESNRCHSENKNVINKIETRKETLKKKFDKLGFSATINSSLKDIADMRMPDNTEEVLKTVSTRLIDIKT